MRHGLILATLFLSGRALASEHEVSVGGSLTATSELYLTLPSRPSFEATYLYTLDAWRLGGGVRWTPSPGVSLPLELYVRALLSGQVGPWQPAVGPEVGLSGVPVVPTHTNALPADYPDSRLDRFGPVYVALHAAPLRFVYRRFSASALELQWGTHVTPRPGSNLRLQVGLLRVGVSL